MSNLVLIRRYAELSGYSEKAIRRKIERGVWVVGREIVKSPDGRLHVDIPAVERWTRGRNGTQNMKRGLWGWQRGVVKRRVKDLYPSAPLDTHRFGPGFGPEPFPGVS